MKDFKDRGWAWVIATACFWTSLTATGILQSYGVLYTIVTDELRVSKEAASWPFTIGFSFAGIGVAVNCLLNGFVSIRKQAIVASILSFSGIFVCYFSTSIALLCIFFGAVYGFGSGVLYGGSLVIVCQYFQRYATVATGILFAGISLSSMSYPPLLEHLSDIYGISGCLLIVSGTALNSLIGALLYCAPPSEEPQEVLAGENNDSSKFTCKSTSVEITLSGRFPDDANGIPKSFKRYLLNELKLWMWVFKYPMFVVITIGFEFYYFSYISYLMIITDNAMDVGVDKIKASLLISMFSASELFGRLSSGWIVDLGWMKARTLLQVAYVSLGVTYAVTPILTSYVTLALSTCVAGYLNATIGINWTVSLNSYLGLKLLSPAIAVSGLMFVLLSSSFPFLIRYFREIGGNYDVLFYLFGTMQLASAIVWFFEPMAVKIKERATS